MSIVNKLPPLPYTNYNEYILSYRNNSYYLVSFDRLIYDKIDSNGCILTDYYSYFWLNPGSDEWNVKGSTIGTPPYCSVRCSDIIASTVNIYNSDGSFYCSASHRDYFSDSISVVSDSITSSTCLSALHEVRFIAPLLIVSVVLIVAFRKCWNFFKGVFTDA